MKKSEVFAKMQRKAEAELNLCEKQCAELTAKIDSLKAQRSTLTERYKSRDLTLRNAQGTLADARERYEKQVELAKMAEGLPTYEAALKRIDSLKAAQDDAQQALVAIEERQRSETALDEAMDVGLSEELEQCIAELQAVNGRMVALQSAKETAFGYQGQSCYEEIAEHLAALRTDLAEKRNEVAQAEQALNEAVTQASQALAQWPSLQAQVAPRIIQAKHDDELTEVLSSFAEFMEIYIEHLDRLRGDVVLPSGIGYRNLLVLNPLEGSHEAHLPALVRRLKAIHKYLEAYRRENNVRPSGDDMPRRREKQYAPTSFGMPNF